MSRLLLLVLLLGHLLATPPAHAHALSPALLQIEALSTTHYQILWRHDLRSRLPPPGWPTDCEARTPIQTQQGSALDLSFELHCERSLAGRRLEFTGLAQARTTVVMTYQPPDGSRQQALISAGQSSHVLPDERPRRPIWQQYLQLGAEHIAQGADHLLLVLGLFLLARGSRQLLVAISAFTLGHSLSLILATWGRLSTPSAGVEFAIALTLLYLAWEMTRQGQPARLRWPLMSAFGLIHGLGFAGALGQIRLPEEQLLSALLSFNLGIEAGQLGFVLLLALLFGLLRRLQSETAQRLSQQICIYLIGSLACFWLIERGLAGLSGLV